MGSEDSVVWVAVCVEESTRGLLRGQGTQSICANMHKRHSLWLCWSKRGRGPGLTPRDPMDLAGGAGK